MKTRVIWRGIVSALGWLAAFAFLAPAHAGPINGTLYFTTFAGGQNVHSVPFAYNGTNSFSLGGVTFIASTPGADGIVFTSDGFLAVGGQGNAVYRVNPSAVNSFTSQNAGGTSAFHMMVAPNGTIYSSGIPGTPASYNSTLTSNGVAHTVSGSTSAIDTIIWPNAADSLHAVYTSSGSGGNGTIGFLNLTNPANFVTTQVAANVAAAHGGTYDPFTNTIILFGDSHITQFDPVTLAPIPGGDRVFAGLNFDQGTVDGLGHIFAATNDGFLEFLDITGTGLVSTANFVASPFLAAALDDVAPLSGGGSNPHPTPEPASLALLAIGLAGLGFARCKR